MPTNARVNVPMRETASPSASVHGVDHGAEDQRCEQTDRGRGGQGDDCCDRGNPVGSHQPKCRAPRLFRCCGGE